MPYYNHNDHYAPLLLRHVPQPCTDALDVGCGEGRLVRKLAEVSTSVVGIDPDPASIVAARRVPNESAELIRADFLDHDFGERRFDFISAVASVHHVPLDRALEKMAGLLRPGGVLVVLGLYRSATIGDRAVAMAALPVNTALAWTRPSADMAAPAVEPTMTLRSIRATATKVLPGANLRRLLLWRYLLTWTDPTRR